MANDDTEREMGIELGELRGDLESESYPMDADEVVEQYGDREVKLSNGTETVEEILGPLDDTFQDSDGVEAAFLNMVGDEAIGRKGYSDRTPPAPGEEEDQDSF